MKVLVTSKSFGKLSKEPVRRLEEAGFTVILNLSLIHICWRQLLHMYVEQRL